MWLNFASCAACLLFLQGLCQCYQDLERGGPRATSDCISCKCITLWHVMKKKKKARKYLYHMNNEWCGCSVSCLISGERRCTKPGSKYDRIAYHPMCMESWVQCPHMQKVSEQLERYSAFVSEQGTLLPPVLEGCCPLIGYDKKVSTMIHVQNPSDFISKRRAAIQLLKLKKTGSKAQPSPCIAWVPQDEVYNNDTTNTMTNTMIVQSSFEHGFTIERALERDNLSEFVDALKIIQNAALDAENVSFTQHFCVLHILFFSLFLFRLYMLRHY